MKIERFISFFLFLITILFAWLYLNSIGQYWNISSDSFHYLKQATCLAESTSLNDIYNCWKKALMPLGSSFIFSLVIFPFGRNYIFLNAICTAALLWAIFVSFLWLRKKYSNFISLFAALIMIASIYVFGASIRIMSDLVFFLFFILAIYFSELLYVNSEVNKKNFFLFSLFALFASLVRINGICLFLAAIIFWLRVRWKNKIKVSRLILINLALIIISAVINLNHIIYLRKFSLFKVAFAPEKETLSLYDRFGFIMSGSASYFDRLKLWISNSWSENGYLWMFLTIIFISITLTYLIVGVFKKNRIVYYATAMICLMYLNHYATSTRYIIPIMPVFLYFFFGGMKKIAEKLKINRASRVVVLMLLLIYLSFYCWRGFGTIYAWSKEQHATNVPGSNIKLHNINAQILGDWIRLNTDKHTKYMTYQRDYMKCITERKGVEIPFSKDDKYFFIRIKKEKPDYVLADEGRGNVKKYLLPHIERHQEVYELIDSKGKGNKKASLYKIHHEKVPAVQTIRN